MNLADNPTTTSVALQSAITVSFTAFFRDTTLAMIPFLCVVAVAMAVDLKLGIRVSRHRGEQIRISRAIRRTMGKIVEYTGIVMLGASATVAFDTPVFQYIGGGAAVAADAALFAQRRCKRLAQGNAHVLDRVVVVHVDVSVTGEGEIESAVLGKQGEHVVEKSNARADL